MGNHKLWDSIILYFSKDSDFGEGRRGLRCEDGKKQNIKWTPKCENNLIIKGG